MDTKTEYHRSNRTEPNYFSRITSKDAAILIYSLFIFTLVLIAYLCSIFLFTPHSPDEMALNKILLAPFQDEQGLYWLGTDYLGRDILTRLIMGVQAYFLPGLLAVSIAIGIGSLLGALSIFAQQSIQKTIKYLNDFLQTVPRLVLLLLIIAIFEPDIYLIMTIIGISNIPSVANLVSARVEILRDKSFVDFAKTSGLPPHSIIFKHLLWYNCRALIISQAALAMGEAILMETSLSYLGFGVQEPAPSWGNMVQTGANYLLQGNYWSSTIPALAIMMVLSALYLFSHTVIRILDKET
jgi:peptide/nickel transport system permease protein